MLEDGTRVLSENGITNAILGSRSGASKRLKKAAKNEGALLPLFLAPPRLEPLIDKALRDGPLKPLDYLNGRTLERGFDANLLPAVCEIWSGSLLFWKSRQLNPQSLPCVHLLWQIRRKENEILLPSVCHFVLNRERV